MQIKNGNHIWWYRITFKNAISMNGRSSMNMSQVISICKQVSSSIKNISYDELNDTLGSAFDKLPLNFCFWYILWKVCSRDNIDKSLHYKYNIDAQMPKTVIGDPGRLKQVLINLVSNVKIFTQEEKPLSEGFSICLVVWWWHWYHHLDNHLLSYWPWYDHSVDIRVLFEYPSYYGDVYQWVSLFPDKD